MKKDKTNKNLDKQIEIKLLAKLKVLGSILILFGVVSLVYSFVLSPYPSAKTSFSLDEIELAAGFVPIEDSPAIESTVQENLNLFMVAAVFFSVGATCLLIAWRKKRILKNIP